MYYLKYVLIMHMNDMMVVVFILNYAYYKQLYLMVLLKDGWSLLNPGWHKSVTTRNLYFVPIQNILGKIPLVPVSRSCSEARYVTICPTNSFINNCAQFEY